VRFDWYQATIEDVPAAVIEAVSSLGHCVSEADNLAHRYRYDQGFSVHDESGIVAHVFSGGNGKNPHAFASGGDTDAFVKLVRSLWPDRHLVTRADAAEDFHEKGAYDRILDVSRAVAADCGLQFLSIGDDLNPLAGRTQYVGGSKSDCRARLYEKGLEQLQKLSPAGSHVTGFSGHILDESTGEYVDPVDWVRLELQVRPKSKEARRAMASVTPQQAWAYTGWTQRLASDAMSLEIERFHYRQKKLSRDEVRIAWMCKHYGKLLFRRNIAHDGKWAEVWKEVEDVLFRMYQDD